MVKNNVAAPIVVKTSSFAFGPKLWRRVRRKRRIPSNPHGRSKQAGRRLKSRGPSDRVYIVPVQFQIRKQDLEQIFGNVPSHLKLHNIAKPPLTHRFFDAFQKIVALEFLQARLSASRMMRNG